MDSTSLSKLHVIDFTKENLKPGTSSWASVANDVRLALEEHGCFIAVYDEVPHDASFSMLESTFDLPIEVKMKNTSPNPQRGYIGQQSIFPLYESVGIEDALLFDNIQEFSNIMWPSGNNQFCETMHSYATRVAELEGTIVKMVFDSYSVGKYYESFQDSSSYLLRLMKYRPPQEDENNIGIYPHTDTSFLTILHGNQVNALEVQTKDGEYIGVEFQSTSFFVQAGDAFMAWSNGRVKSAYHRVLMEKGKKDIRYSIGVFRFNKGIIETPEELVDEHPRKFKAFDHYGFIEFSSKMMLDQIKERTIIAYCGINN